MAEEPYRPSNGTEGLMFFEQWCSRCKKDDTFRRDDPENSELRCSIIDAVFVLDRDDPDYPKEWVYDPDDMMRDGCLTIGEGGARCTAFEALD